MDCLSVRETWNEGRESNPTSPRHFDLWLADVHSFRAVLIYGQSESARLDRDQTGVIYILIIVQYHKNTVTEYFQQWTES